MMPIDSHLCMEPLSARQVALCGLQYGLQITHPLLQHHVEVAEAAPPDDSILRHDATKPAPTQWWLCLDEEDCRPWLVALSAARDARRQSNADVSRRQKAVVAPALALLAGRFTAGASPGSTWCQLSCAPWRRSPDRRVLICQVRRGPRGDAGCAGHVCVAVR